MTDSSIKKQVLIVEDNKVNLTILKRILESDYDVFTADNRQIAIQIVNSKVGKSISIVVLDIAMPIMDGYEVLCEMKRNYNLSGIPVIVASGNDSIDSENKEVLALSLGANDYVTNPYKPEIIKHRISNAIYTRETALKHSAYQYWEHDLIITDICKNGVQGASLGFSDVPPNYGSFLGKSGIICAQYIELYKINQQSLYNGAASVG